MEIILKQRIVGTIVIIAILSLILPIIVISKDEVFNKQLISNIPSKPVFKISLPDDGFKSETYPTQMLAQTPAEQISDSEKPDSSEPPSVNLAADDKRVAVIIPLTDNSDIDPVKKDSVAVQNLESSPAVKKISEPKLPSSNLVASAPSGELTLPDLASISEVLQKYINEEASTNTSLNVKNTVVPAKNHELKQKSLKAVPPTTPKLLHNSKVVTTTPPRKKLALLQKPKRETQSHKKLIRKTVGWVVQVGSFAKKSNASKLQHKLAKNGHKSYVELAKNKYGVIYRVRIGPQINQERAKVVQQKILKQEQLESIVLRYPR